MQKKYENSRQQQKKMLILIIVVFVIAFTMSIVKSVTSSKSEQTTEQNNSTTSYQDTSITDTDTTVTGENGEDNTLRPATVTKVIDGKTIEVRMNSKIIQVQMIGIQILQDKESDAKSYLEKIFKNNDKVWLQYDEQTNNDNRELCYVWLSNKVNVNLVSDCKQYLLQAELIKKHLAVYEAEYPNSRYDYELRTVTE
jgi:staphylococcal nuclease homologue